MSHRPWARHGHYRVGQKSRQRCALAGIGLALVAAAMGARCEVHEDQEAAGQGYVQSEPLAAFSRVKLGKIRYHYTAAAGLQPPVEQHAKRLSGVNRAQSLVYNQEIPGTAPGDRLQHACLQLM